MSVRPCIYLGPYFRARPKLKNQMRDARRCSSGECKVLARQAGAFCPACGKPMEVIKVASGYMVSALSVDISELIDDRMLLAFTRHKVEPQQPTEHWEIWLPNLAGPRKFWIQNYEDHEFAFETVEHFRQAEIVWINTTFQKELEIFKLHYLEAEISWGLLTWAN